MYKPKALNTPRMRLEQLSPAHADFMMELLNSAQWINFIGDRNVRLKSDVLAYIEHILTSDSTEYFVCILKEKPNEVGIVTLLKRPYLDHWDIGFALLTQYFKQGLAREAVSSILKELFEKNKLLKIAAITKPDNSDSINLLTKIGFQYQKEMSVDARQVFLYEITGCLFFHDCITVK